MFAAALPGGLSAYLAGGGSTHDYLLPCRGANSSADPRHGVASFRPLRLVTPSHEASQRTECSDLSVVTPGCD